MLHNHTFFFAVCWCDSLKTAIIDYIQNNTVHLKYKDKLKLTLLELAPQLVDMQATMSWQIAVQPIQPQALNIPSKPCKFESHHHYCTIQDFQQNSISIAHKYMYAKPTIPIEPTYYLNTLLWNPCQQSRFYYAFKRHSSWVTRVFCTRKS